MERSVDHRTAIEMISDPERVAEILCTPPECGWMVAAFRWSTPLVSTTGLSVQPFRLKSVGAFPKIYRQEDHRGKFLPERHPPISA